VVTSQAAAATLEQSYVCLPLLFLPVLSYEQSNYKMTE